MYVPYSQSTARQLLIEFLRFGRWLTFQPRWKRACMVRFWGHHTHIEDSVVAWIPLVMAATNADL